MHAPHSDIRKSSGTSEPRWVLGQNSLSSPILAYTFPAFMDLTYIHIFTYIIYIYICRCYMYVCAGD